LQNMYVRMAEVSKQQSAIQQANALAQETAAREIAKKSSDEESRVAETRDLEDGTEKDQGVGLHEDGKAKNPYNRGQRRRSGAEGDNETGKESASGESDIFKDPDLGNRVDIST